MIGRRGTPTKDQICWPSRGRQDRKRNRARRRADEQTGVDIVGVLPAELQDPSAFVYTLASSASGDQASARALIDYISPGPCLLEASG